MYENESGYTPKDREMNSKYYLYSKKNTTKYLHENIYLNSRKRIPEYMLAYKQIINLKQLTFNPTPMTSSDASGSSVSESDVDADSSSSLIRFKSSWKPSVSSEITRAASSFTFSFSSRSCAATNSECSRNSEPNFSKNPLSSC